MLLSKRQFEIFKFLIENHDIYISTEVIADKLNVSSRTIKNDIPIIKKYTLSYKSFILETIPGKGLIISTNNIDFFMEEMLSKSTIETDLYNLNDNDRDLAILKYLINKDKYINKKDVMNNFFISESTFYKVYNNIKTIIKPFNLNIELSKSNGYQIIGFEKDKRNLIARFELIDSHRNIYNNSFDISNTYNFIADTFISFEYKVTEAILQNISSHVLLMIYRIKNGHYIETFESNELTNKIEYQIAKLICTKLVGIYNLEVHYFENEVLLLTQTILGKINYSIDEKLQIEVNNFINNTFKSINTKFGINFENIERLRLLLSLHLVPLIYRINSRTQLKNLMAIEIKQQFPHANDIALFFSILFKDHFHISISPDELSYISLYFNFGIEELNISKSSKSLLIITKLRPSETVLLRHKLLTWFPNQIMDITFINPNDDIDDLEQYDAVFATELYFKEYANAVTLIKVFPDESDFRRINLALNGYTSVDSIIEKFNPGCFFRGLVSDKQEILKILCDNAIKTYGLENDFFDYIWSREEIASTFFGDFIAIPHPLAPITDESLVSIGILEKPIVWDSTHSVQLIMLISIEKNNPKAFQFWHYMSDIVRNHETVRELLKCKNYDSFIDTIKGSLTIIEAK